MHKIVVQTTEEKAEEDPFFDNPLFRNEEINIFDAVNKNPIGNNFN